MDENERLMVAVMALFEDGVCQARCPDGDTCDADWCPAMERVLEYWIELTHTTSDGGDA